MTTMRSLRLGKAIARSFLNVTKDDQCQTTSLILNQCQKCEYTTFTGHSVRSILKQQFFTPFLQPEKKTEKIGCRTATVQDKEKIVNFLCEDFLRREPLMKVLKATKQDARAFVDYHVTDALKHSASFVAVDENDHLCGIRLNAVGPDEERSNDVDFGTKMNTLEKFLQYVEADLTKQLHTPRIMRHIAICVNPDIVRSGVGTMMMQKSVDYAKEHGLQYMVATCSGKIATKLALKMGFRIVREVAYDSYINPRSHFAQFPDDCLVNSAPHLPFLSLADEHVSAKLMIKNV